VEQSQKVFRLFGDVSRTSANYSIRSHLINAGGGLLEVYGEQYCL